MSRPKFVFQKKKRNQDISATPQEPHLAGNKRNRNKSTGQEQTTFQSEGKAGRIKENARRL
jgi:hypothetical protein